jgi:hypothetical protein
MISFLAMIAVAFVTQSALADTPKGQLTAACAHGDIRAFSLIEERNATAGTRTEWLAEAGLKHLQARLFCLSGEEDKGVKLYQSIIDDDMSLSNAGTVR